MIPIFMKTHYSNINSKRTFLCKSHTVAGNIFSKNSLVLVDKNSLILIKTVRRNVKY